MSATGRGGKRRSADFYPTPSHVTTRILERLALPGGWWLEPAAGDGAIIRAVAGYRSDVRWLACELRDECVDRLRQVAEAVLICNFLVEKTHPVTTRRFDVAILNPPFSSALDVVRRCLDRAEWVVCLERVNWLASQDREHWMRSHTPDVYLLPNRPSFTGEGTDATEYAWMVWPPDGHERTSGRIEVLSSSPRQQALFPTEA